MFTDTAVSGNCSIIYREGSGLVTLKGATNQRRARFKISFGANIAIPTGALAINGEPVQATQMIQTPAAVAEFSNVSRTLFLDVLSGCCTQISIENTSTETISVQNANLIVERVA